MNKKVFYFLLVSVIPLVLLGCGGGSGGDSGSSGTVTMNVTDTKPTLPSGVEQVLITFDEVSVHKSGGEWVSLGLAQTPYTIDLLQFQSGTTTQLVAPASLTPGKYTQVRIGVASATIRIDGANYQMDIPSDNLKTDKNFEFDVTGGGAVDLTVDFDLSQSIVVTGQQNYKLKPVLHLNQTQEAATIRGKISNSLFGNSSEAVVIVTWDTDGSGGKNSNDEEYTRVTVEKSSTDSTEFSIYWLVPEEGYTVQVEVDGNIIDLEPPKFVSAASLPAGGIVDINFDSGN